MWNFVGKPNISWLGWRMKYPWNKRITKIRKKKLGAVTEMGRKKCFEK